MRGWFDAFRNDGGPTLYSYSNRTAVTGDVPTISLYVLFFTLFIAFVIIFPGVRKERFTTFTSVTLSLFVGSAILVSKYGSAWHVADTSIMSYYRAFSREKLAADIGVHIGLMHFNVTLQDIYISGVGVASLKSNHSMVQNGVLSEDIDYNERFHWESATDIQEEFREALVKGLPYPILTVVEYFSMDEEGFCWGRSYRQAGYYASILLWASFASWCLMNLLLVVVPRYGAYQMIVTGCLMVTTDVLYYMLIPEKKLMIRFEESFLMFKFGWCFWLVGFAGVLCLFAGIVIAVIDLMYPHKFSTILEVDYGTPFDRHIIIEESHYTKRNKRGSGKRSLEEPETLGLGRKILRTLSKRSRSDDLMPQGVLNQGFELDPPKSPWMGYPYPHHHMYRADGTPLRPAILNVNNNNAFAKNPALARLAAPTPTKSPKSVSFRRQSRLTETFQLDPMRLRRSESNDSAASGSSTSSSGIVGDHHNHHHHHQTDDTKFQNPARPVERTESGSSLSSLGLGLLSRTHSKRDVSTNPHIAICPQLSGQDLQLDPSHLPLSRIVYKKKPIGLLPRASLERKSSTENENGSSARRDSNNSEKNRSVSNSGFGSAGFDIRHHKRPGPDGHEETKDRRSSNESVTSNANHHIALREPDW